MGSTDRCNISLITERSTGSSTIEPSLSVLLGKKRHLPRCLWHNKADPITGAALEIKQKSVKTGASDNFAWRVEEDCYRWGLTNSLLSRRKQAFQVARPTFLLKGPKDLDVWHTRRWVLVQLSHLLALWHWESHLTTKLKRQHLSSSGGAGRESLKLNRDVVSPLLPAESWIVCFELLYVVRAVSELLQGWQVLERCAGLPSISVRPVRGETGLWLLLKRSHGHVLATGRHGRFFHWPSTLLNEQQQSYKNILSILIICGFCFCKLAKICDLKICTHSAFPVIQT